MKQSILLTLAATAATAHETLAPQYSESIARKGWTATAPADPTTFLRLTVALKQENLDKLKSTLHDVSNPDSSNYGKFLTHDEVNSLVAPSDTTLHTVTTWLAEHAAVETTFAATPNKDFLHVDVTVAQAEELLSSKYWTYTQKETGRTITRLAPGIKYSLPSKVAAAVDFVGPTLTFPPHFTSLPTGEELKSALAKPSITPPRLRALANMTDADVGKGVADATGIKQESPLFWARSMLQRISWRFVKNMIFQRILWTNFLCQYQQVKSMIMLVLKHPWMSSTLHPRGTRLLLSIGSPRGPNQVILRTNHLLHG